MSVRNRIRILRRLDQSIKDPAVARAILRNEEAIEELIEAIGDVGSVSLFTATTSGIVPASGGGSTNFLRADGSWAAPPSGGEVNTASNVGGGAGVWKDKSGVDLRFRSLIGTGMVTSTENTNDVTLDAEVTHDTSLVGAGTAASPLSVNWNVVGTGAYFGGGIDGDLTFDGVSTVLGLVPSSGVYTLDRDIFAATLTVDGGVTVFTNNFRVWAETEAIVNGTISCSGANGGNASGTSGGTVVATSTQVFSPGGKGGNGGNGGSGAPGGAGGSSLPPYGFVAGTISGTSGNGASGSTGQGGAGGGNGASNGGNGGTMNTPAVTVAPFMNVLSCLITGRDNGNQRISPGTGGGGGRGGQSPGGGGGAGGNGGGICVLIARKVSGSGAVRADGGNGGNGAATTNGGGGGAGGGGGVAGIVVGSGTVSLSVSADGGQGGLGATGSINGGNGGDGGDGITHIIYYTA